MANMDKVIVTKEKRNTYTGPFPHKNSPQIARTDNEQIAKLKTFKGVPFIEDNWTFPKDKAFKSQSDEWYTGKRNHVTEER